jgi:hypothetical protein
MFLLIATIVFFLIFGIIFPTQIFFNNVIIIQFYSMSVFIIFIILVSILCFVIYGIPVYKQAMQDLL